MRIENHISFWAAVLAFIGTVVIVMDSFTPIHRMIDQYPKWKNIGLAMADLDTFDWLLKNGKTVGMVEEGEPGFSELVYVIRSNRSSLPDEPIVKVVKNKPVIIGGVPLKIVHVVVQNSSNAVPLTTAFIFQEWVQNHRAKYFLKIGLSIIIVSFFLSVIAHIKWKKE